MVRTRVGRWNAAAVSTALMLVAASACGGDGDPGARGSTTTTSTTSTTTSTTSTTTSGVPPSTTSGVTTSTASTTTTRPRTTTTRPASPTTAGSATTTAAPAAPSGPLPRLAGRVVVLDAGHNGGNAAHSAEINRLVDIGNGTKACNTTGTASNDGYAESSFTFDVAARAAALLRAAGATVVLTRTTNDGWGPCIDERAAVANRAHAAAAVSIHADGAGPSSRGFHVIEPKAVPGLNDAIVGPSSHLAVALRDAMVRDAGLPPSNYVGRDGLIARDDLGGLNLAQVPAVFVECGNMRNAADVAVLRSPDGRQRIALAIAVGIAADVTSR